MPKKTTRENREDILITAFLTCPNISEVSKKTGIPRSTIYKVTSDESFQNKLAEARREAISEAITYLQGNLSECSRVLMEIVGDKKAPPQVRINAINSVFQNVRGYKENNAVLAGMAVRIIDNI